MKLEIRNASKRYATTQALDSLSLTIGSARVLVLIGPSGGGKSTLLRALGGLETLDAGSVEINGHRLTADPSNLQAYRRRNGFLFQQFSLFPHLTARRNITLPLEKVHGHLPEQARALADESLGRFGLLDHADKLPEQLSGGQQQRVGIARALIQNPKLLLCDEPIASLDPSAAKIIMDTLKDINQRLGITIIVNLHQVDVAMRYAQRIIGINSGKIICDAPPHTLNPSIIHEVYGSEAGELILDFGEQYAKA
jgi:ABC-type phosphate/phosphonate transport system ATPase subunit